MKILLIVNPVATGYSKGKVEKIKKILNLNLISSKFDNVETVLTASSLDGYNISKASDADIVIAAGGDGLVNEVVAGMYGKKDKFFSVLPLGAVNVFCKEYGIDDNPIKAAKNITLSKFIEIPVGFIDDKLFVLFAGFGFDAEVVRLVESNKKRILPKKLSYVFTGLKVLLTKKFGLMDISAKGYDHNPAHLIVSIVSSYAGKHPLGKLDAGKLNLFAIFKTEKKYLIKSLLSIFTNRGFVGSRMQADYIKINDVTLAQIDGESYSIDKKSVFISIKEKAVKLIF